MSCSITKSPAAQNWPEGIITVKLTMNPYLFAMAHEEAAKQGLSVWEIVNIALWEKLGKPDRVALMEFAATLDLNDEDPKWKKRAPSIIPRSSSSGRSIMSAPGFL